MGVLRAAAVIAVPIVVLGASCSPFDAEPATPGDPALDAGAADAWVRPEGCAPPNLGPPAVCSTTVVGADDITRMELSLPWRPIEGDTVVVVPGTAGSAPSVARLGTTVGKILTSGADHVAISIVAFAVEKESSRSLVLEFAKKQPTSVAIITEWRGLGLPMQAQVGDKTKGEGTKTVDSSVLDLPAGDWLALAVAGVHVPTRAPTNEYTAVDSVMAGITGVSLAARRVSGPIKSRTSWQQEAPDLWNTLHVAFPIR